MPVYGIENGVIASDVNIIGSCIGNNLDLYECGGTNNYIKWSTKFGIEDFVIESEFKVSSIASTAVAFVFYEGNTLKFFGLDGGGKTLFYEGGSWGSAKQQGNTPVIVNKFHKIKFVRLTGRLTTYLDGKQIGGVLDLGDDITAVGWRPWRNTINVKSLYYDKGIEKNLYQI